MDAKWLVAALVAGCASPDPDPSPVETGEPSDTGSKDTGSKDTGSPTSPQLVAGALDDLLVTSASGTALLYARGDGSWLEGPVWDDLVLGSVAFTPGDFDGDGISDLVVTTAEGSSWWFTRPDGSFSPSPVETGLVLGEVRLVAGDVNGDGLDDVIVQGSDAWETWISAGSTFVRGEPATIAPSGAHFALADYTVDGGLDLVQIDIQGLRYRSYSDGWGEAFIHLPQWSVGNGMAWSADFDGDGQQDILTASAEGTKWFDVASNYALTEEAHREDLPFGDVAYDVGDFDGDGTDDLVITTLSAVSRYLSNGDYSFRASRIRSETIGHVTHVVADLDGNGRSDLLSVTDEGTDVQLADEDGALPVVATEDGWRLGSVMLTATDLGYPE